MSAFIVTRVVLELYDSYDGDFGLLDERWADPKDREKVSPEQMLLFSEYVDKLHLIKLDTASLQEMQQKALKRISQLESLVDPEVVRILRVRIFGSAPGIA